MLLALAVLPTSCADDDILNPTPGEYTDRVCFSTTAPAFEPDTRSAAQADCFVLHPQKGRDSLFVNTTICNFDDSASPATRAQLTTSASLNSFMVSAFAMNNGAWTSFFPEEEITRESEADTWEYTSGNVHFWPGAEHPMRFCAYSPSKATGLNVNHSMTNGVPNTLSFTVQSDVAAQVDLLAAKADDVPGDYNSVYPLEFKHICTAIQFKEGAGMQPGALKKVELAGVYNSGTYSFGSESWTLDTSSRSDFTQTLNPTAGKEMTQQEGTAITDDSDCLIMMPQTLPEGAQLRVTFHDKVTGQDREMTASLAGKTWPQGRKVVYTLSITPDYKLDFASEPAVQDAHYVIYPIKITSDKAIPGGWTLTSNNPDNVTFVEKFDIQDIKTLVDAGYWLDGYNGTSTLKSTTTGEVTVYVFLKENATREDRNITLSLRPTAVDNMGETAMEKATKKFTFTQYCPAWNGDLGVERIQDEDFPWGFNWDFKVQVKFTSSGILDSFLNILIRLYIRFSDLSDYVSVKGSWGTFTAEIDYAKISALPSNVAISDDDGKTNTWQLRNATKASDVAALIQQMESWGGEVQGNMDYALDFAARGCAMKNKFRVETATQSGKTVYRPVLDEDNMVWYLPARNEAALMQDNLSGDYWTSTTLSNQNTSAYKYTAGGGTSLQDRATRLHVRAVRRAL